MSRYLAGGIGIVGQGSVHSTTLDLLKWDRALYTSKLLSKEGLREIFEVATLEDKSKTEYGGGWPGYVTFIDRQTTNDKTIIILQNHNNVIIPIKQILSILYNKPSPVN